MEKLIIEYKPDEWRISLFKSLGLNKGTTVLATFCGGNLGMQLAIENTRILARQIMPNEFELICKDRDKYVEFSAMLMLSSLVK